MSAPQPRPRSRWLWLAHRASAWITCILVLGWATTAALRTVEAAANRSLADWRARRHAAAGTTSGAIPLVAGVMVKQLLPVGGHGLRGIRVATTAGGAPRAAAAQPVAWKVVHIAAPGGTNALLRSGTVTSDDIDPAGWIHIDFEPLAASPSGRHLLKLIPPDDPGPHPLSLVLLHALEPRSPPVVTAGPASLHPPAQPPPGTGLQMRLIDAATPADTVTARGGLP